MDVSLVQHKGSNGLYSQRIEETLDRITVHRVFKLELSGDPKGESQSRIGLLHWFPLTPANTSAPRSRQRLEAR